MKLDFVTTIRSVRTREVLEIGLLDFTVFGPDDFTTVVHAHSRLLSTKLP